MSSIIPPPVKIEFPEQVALSSAIDGNRTSVAATEKGVGDAYRALTSADDVLNDQITYARKLVGRTAVVTKADAIAEANAFTETKFDELLGQGTTAALDTIVELARAYQQNADYIAAIQSAISQKLGKSEKAANTALFDGKTFEDVIAEARAGLSPNTHRGITSSLANGSTSISLSARGGRDLKNSLNSLTQDVTNKDTALRNELARIEQKADDAEANRVYKGADANQTVFPIGHTLSASLAGNQLIAVNKLVTLKNMQGSNWPYRYDDSLPSVLSLVGTWAFRGVTGKANTGGGELLYGLFQRVR
ncbi:hypothetical protein INR79_01650 [Vibrio sp. SCSIO 43132]|uniref:hypothetical protein n=1 Tax=Vibrio sp. SCSIO 43132 TaxID=2779363 RepID=UPI001CA7D719|nr:hypothetical protein [Vibrio sp. SCSIO 43132]UAB70658.1 hypothetical protein INR79_01650 [Vibrio sp. SCSIO 43132]